MPETLTLRTDSDPNANTKGSELTYSELDSSLLAALYNAVPFETLSFGTPTTWDLSSIHENVELTLTGDTTIDASNVEDGRHGLLAIIQDGTGGRSVTLGTNIATEGGLPLLLDDAAGATTLFTYVVQGGSVLISQEQGFTTETKELTGTSYTLALGDALRDLEFSNSSAITVTIPANSTVAFPVGTIIPITQTGAGQVSVTGDTGVTLNGTGTSLASQWSGGVLKKRDTDLWLIQGDLA
jgi:hypothetical protein